ncbi:winged helix DNA-binding domain-containing protein [Jannaschia sp. S6380]|uniref:winged helix-turn-helix domain-containing protein n=1 Tax=Jannaschia sp. S6380 TaxID=2926408 RepID=UPI001FF48B29|nr:crosslink repair DNA glycosylase YcaQ family protein [Jannaschia sp. S6380]MCK0168287.1 winged helix DNA-binding domain-containing protein [Jannaschia sp. S6380]
MTVLPQIPNATARALFLQRHGLGAAPAGPGPGRGADLLGVIDALGFVQIDSIDTVARAHHMILHARRTAYRPSALHRLHDHDRALFEHWTHDASMIPMRFYPHWRLRFRRYAALRAARWAERGRPAFADHIDAVLAHVARHGPCRSADIGMDEARSGTGWWDWHPSKAAMEHLWQTGRLAVTRRDGFQKVYDLTENVIPPAHLQARPDPADTIEWACRAALDRLGFATPGELAAFWDLVTPAEARVWSDAALERGAVVPAEVAGADGRRRRVLTHPDTWTQAPSAAPGRMRVLSPFDPALRDRKRAEWLFGFHYRIEVFVPEARRRYGYYVFPLLEGDRLIGRVDMKADRSRDRLHLRALWPEPDVVFAGGRRARLDAALVRTARLAGMSNIDFAEGWLRAG